MNKGRLFVISAPSGAGKTSLVMALLQNAPFGCAVERVVTYTTRAPRPGEVQDQAYHFITKELFEAKIKSGFFLEWSSWYQDYYGSARDVLKKLGLGKNYIMILDRAGARAVKQAYPAAELIWIQPPSLEVLKARLEKRGDTQSSLTFRLERAAFEMQEEAEKKLYNHVVVNDSFEQALQALKLIICG